MQREIDDKLANLLLAGEVEDGSFVKVDVSEDQQALEVHSVREDASV
jgi:ATP-dependent Clp protease ATP-binding subunit ClpB